MAWIVSGFEELANDAGSGDCWASASTSSRTVVESPRLPTAATTPTAIAAPAAPAPTSAAPCRANRRTPPFQPSCVECGLSRRGAGVLLVEQIVRALLRRVERKGELSRRVGTEAVRPREDVADALVHGV